MRPDQVAHITLWRCPDCPVLIPSTAGRLPSVDVHEKQHEGEKLSDVIEKLRRARGMAWADLVPAFDHAIVLAEEAEANAERAANEAQVSTRPAYPALVVKLAESIRDEPGESEYGYVCTRRDMAS